MFPIESAIYILRKCLTWKQIAEAMGVSVQDARRWNGMMGEHPRGGLLVKLNALCSVVILLEKHRRTRRDIIEWLEEPNSLLGHKAPLAAFHEKGGAHEVRKAAKSYVEGVVL